MKLRKLWGKKLYCSDRPSECIKCHLLKFYGDNYNEKELMGTLMKQH